MIHRSSRKSVGNYNYDVAVKMLTFKDIFRRIIQLATQIGSLQVLNAIGGFAM